MIALLAAPTVAARFDLEGRAVWDLDALDKELGGWFDDHDPAIGFAADQIMTLEPLRS